MTHPILVVELHGSVVGHIVQVSNGYRYAQKKTSKDMWGEVYSTIDEVKKDIE